MRYPVLEYIYLFTAKTSAAGSGTKNAIFPFHPRNAKSSACRGDATHRRGTGPAHRHAIPTRSRRSSSISRRPPEPHARAAGKRTSDRRGWAVCWLSHMGPNGRILAQHVEHRSRQLFVPRFFFFFSAGKIACKCNQRMLAGACCLLVVLLPTAQSPPAWKIWLHFSDTCDQSSKFFPQAINQASNGVR